MAELTGLELDQLHQSCAEIADLADGLKDMLSPALEGNSMYTVTKCILDRVIALAEVFV